MTSCLKQSTKTVKLSDKMVFACIGELAGVPRLLTGGICYEPCSPLVQEEKGGPLKPMTSPNECIVAFVPACGIDLSGTGDCKAPVYDEVDVYKENVNWPKDEEGNQLFSVADVETICQGHHCCIRFLSLAGYRKAPDWVKNQNSTGKKVA